MPIKVLADETINKIAAGEVVERPANAVKELVENAIDAGAANIEVEIRKAGRHLIRVTDNGCGMSREDLSLAVLRHATSKITDFTDLTSLHTLGFRGEALPSIAAVSHLRIRSQQPSADSGWELFLSGGRVTENRAWAGAPGTTIEAEQLFFNTPAREKFLKSDPTERSHIVRVLEETALSHPAIAFTLISDGKKLLSAPPAGDDRERLMDVLGADLTAALLPVNVHHPRMTVKAWVTKRDCCVSSREFQYLFINGRPVTLGKLLTHSLYEAYRENLQVGKHPGAVIFIEIDPSDVDVNIHPAKREVKFAKEREVHDLLCRAIKEVVCRSPFESLPVPAPEQTTSSAPAPAPNGSRAFLHPPVPSAQYRPPAAAQPRFEVEQFKAVFGSAGAAVETAPAETGTTVVGQAFSLYIVAEYNGELLIVDQHAAAERIRYEQYRSEWEKKEIPLQPLLFPVTLEMPASRAGLLRENLPLLQEAGWGIEEFGTNTIRVTTVPAVLGTGVEIRDIVNGMLEALIEEAKLPPAEKIDRLIRTACRKSIKAGDRLSPDEMRSLLRRLFQCASPYTCPHGRPTAFKLSPGDLEKYFGRK
jgi:DNA mismatch repair protein MutL